MTNIEYWFEFHFSTFLWIFIILNIVNVVIQTVKAIVTINGTPMSAAIINAFTFAIYTVVVVFMNAEGLGVAWKALIIGVVNFIGVYAVKLWEEKSRKDKLWKVEATVMRTKYNEVCSMLESAKIPHNFIQVGQYTTFNCYCSTKEQSEAIKEILKAFDAKYFVSESKTL